MRVSRNIYFIPIAAMITFIYFGLIIGLDYRDIPNILIYFLGMLIFFFSFLVQLFVCNKFGIFEVKKRKMNLDSTSFPYQFIVVIGIIVLFLSWNWDDQSFMNIKSILLLGLVFSSVFLLTNFHPSTERSNVFRLLLSMLLLVVYAYCLYEPNFLEDSFGGIYHADAYTTSIINVCNGFPFSYENVGIYGHYGIFYLLPVKILSLFVSQWTAIAISISLVGLVSLGLMILFLNNLISNDVVFAASIFSVCFFSFSISYGGNYFQLDPHRYIFQAICLFGCGLAVKYRKRQIYFLMWIVSSLAIVWNLEIGIVCLIVWAVCRIYLLFENGIKVRYLFYSLCGVFLSFGLSILIVDIYNVFCGAGFLDFSTFIYPLGYSFRTIEGGFNILNLSFGMSFPTSIWFVFALIMMSGVCLLFTKFITYKLSNDECLVFLSALMGIGVLAYYANMPLNDNKFLAVPPLVFVLSYVADYELRHFEGMNTKRGNVCFEKFACGMSVVVFLFIFWASISSMYGKIAKIEYHTHNDDQIDSFCSSISTHIPDDTVFIGIGTQQLCAALNRKNALSYMDFPDINEYGISYVCDKISEESYSHIVLPLGTEKLLSKALEKYEICNQFDYYDDDATIRYSYILLRRAE